MLCTVESLKEEKTDAAHWEVVIVDANEEAKKGGLQLIENGAVAAKCSIRKLPFEIRGSAADLFNASWPAVITFFGKAWESIKVIKEGLEMFLKGAWNRLEQAMDAVKAAAEIAIEIICSILKPSTAAAAV